MSRVEPDLPSWAVRNSSFCGNKAKIMTLKCTQFPLAIYRHLLQHPFTLPAMESVLENEEDDLLASPVRPLVSELHADSPLRSFSRIASMQDDSDDADDGVDALKLFLEHDIE